jgi:hypothetical protein
VERLSEKVHSVWLSLARIKDIMNISIDQTGLIVGAGLTITQLEFALRRASNEVKGANISTIKALLWNTANLFTAQIRNQSVINTINKPTNSFIDLGRKCGCRLWCVDFMFGWFILGYTMPIGGKQVVTVCQILYMIRL